MTGNSEQVATLAWLRVSMLTQLVFGGFISIFLAAGCSYKESALEVTTLTGPTMGTHYKVRIVKSGTDSKHDLQKWIDERLTLLNTRMSTYDPESELSRFNASEITEWFEVSNETARVVAYSLELAADSGGAFDPTVGPVVNLWGFGPDESQFQPPSSEAIADALEHVDYSKVEARLDPPALRKSDPEVYLDLSAVAKGHGVDVIAELLQSDGIDAYMVEIGGEVRTRGTKPGGKPWRIGIEKPDSHGSTLQAVLSLNEHAVASSGDYRNFFIHKGRRYSHTIDPITGQPVNHTLATVSVLAPSCREADALATALLVMGPEAGYDWASQREIAALFVTRGAEEQFTEQTTAAWLEAKVTEEALP